LSIAQHVGVRICYTVEGKSPIKHRLQLTIAEGAEHLHGKALAALQCFFRRTRAEGYADDLRALARDLV
jgi:hypothetical protein